MTAPAASTSAGKTPAVWEDFIDILTSPARVFERRRGTGAGMPLFIVAVLAAIISAASMPLMAPMRERQMQTQLDEMRKRGMTDQQIETGRAFGEKIATVATVAGPLIGIPIVVAVVALVLVGVGSLFDARVKYSDAMIITTYSTVPVLLSMILGALALAVMDAEAMPLLQAPAISPAMFLGRDASPVLVAVASRFGLGDLWSLVLTAIGVSVIGRVPRGRGYTVSIVLWVLGLGVAVAIGMRTAAAMGG